MYNQENGVQATPSSANSLKSPTPVVDLYCSSISSQASPYHEQGLSILSILCIQVQHVSFSLADSHGWWGITVQMRLIICVEGVSLMTHRLLSQTSHSIMKEYKNCIFSSKHSVATRDVFVPSFVGASRSWKIWPCRHLRLSMRSSSSYDNLRANYKPTIGEKEKIPLFYYAFSTEHCNVVVQQQKSITRWQWMNSLGSSKSVTWLNIPICKLWKC